MLNMQWKPMYKIWSTIKAQERHEWRCSGVFIKNFKGVGIKFNICDEPFFQFDGKKLKSSTGF